MTLLTTHLLPTCCIALLLCALSLGDAAPSSADAQGLATPAPKPAGGAKADQELFYVGTYTQKTSKGIYPFHLDLGTGEITPAGEPAAAKDPSFLALHPNHRFLYAVDEISDYEGANAGAVTAFSIDPTTGALTTLNQQSSVGAGPCHILVDSSGKNVIVANYGSGSVAVLPIKADGSLDKASAFVQHEGKGVDVGRQEGPHAHSGNFDPTNHFALVADLGLDKILIYRFDPDKGTLSPNAVPAAIVAPGSGPRHTVFHPNGHRLYVINEMKSTVTAFDYDPATAATKEIQTISTLPTGFTGKSTCAEIQISPNGKFLYGSNRGHDSIVIYAIAPKTGKLTLVGHESTQGKTPRNFCIDPSGRYLLAANQDTDNIVVFRIDPKTGRLQATGHTADVSMPVCITFLPSHH